MQTRRFATFAWGVLAFNVLVIVWGAYVRATGSGAGCGSHWPLCNGDIILRSPAIETLIEFTHRATSGLALLLVAALVPLAWRAFPRGHRVRTMALISLAFILIEALLGAGLVLLEYVAHNDSIARAYWVAGHLINTFLLLGVLTLTAWWGRGAPVLQLRGQPGLLLGTLGAALLGMLILGASGGVTALGDTLLLTAGITPEESPLVATLVDMRIYHPLLAFVVGGLLLAAALTARRLRPSPALDRWSLWLGGLFMIQLLLGALNVALKAPVFMQLAHLFVSDMIWITLLLLTANALAVTAPVPPIDDSQSTPVSLAERAV
jgi:heme a synthase